jgi:hypothetical protein
LSESIFNRRQLYLSAEIGLERDDLQQIERLDARGTTTFVDIYRPVHISIPARTAGLVMSFTQEAGKLTIQASFDEDDNLRLSFSAKLDDPDAFFVLDHDESPQDSDSQGALDYGQHTYSLKYEERPHLLILFNRDERNEPTARTAPGRKVADF